MSLSTSSAPTPGQRVTTEEVGIIKGGTNSLLRKKRAMMPKSTAPAVITSTGMGCRNAQELGFISGTAVKGCDNLPFPKTMMSVENKDIPGPLVGDGESLVVTKDFRSIQTTHSETVGINKPDTTVT